MDHPELRRIQYQIESELNSYDNEINKLNALTFPTDTCPNILHELRKRIEGYRDRVDKILHDLDPDNPEETKDKLITQIHNPLVLQQIRFLDWIRNAQTANVPWSFVPCIEDLAKEILPGKSVLVCSENRFNYGMSWSRNEKLAPYPYYVLSLPRPHRTNALWHCLIGHELFHLRCDEFIDQHTKDILSAISKNVPSVYEENCRDDTNANGDLFSEKERLTGIAELTKAIHFAWRRAMEELLSDMACVELFGPAAILAMNAFSACSAKDLLPGPDNQFYPSWHYRLEVAWGQLDTDAYGRLLGQLQEISIAKCFIQNTAALERGVDKAPGATSLAIHPYAKIAYSHVQRLLPEARKFVKESIPSGAAKWYEDYVIQQIPSLVNRISKGLPPNEVIRIVDEMGNGEYKTEPAYLSGLLIAGWVYESYWQKEFTTDGKLMKYMTMCRLLLKACEDSRLMRQN